MPRLSALLKPLSSQPRNLPPEPEDAPFAHAGEEPALDDLLDDPVLHLVLARDGLDRADVRARMTAAARVLQKNGGPGRG